MTQLRRCKCGISNYFDTILHGIGHRGSSFSDVDAISHDKTTRRFLVQEFKQDSEALNAGQHWMLQGLAEIPNHFTVWIVVKRADGFIGFARFGDDIQPISVDEYRARFSAWWSNTVWVPPNAAGHSPVALMDASDIDWWSGGKA